MLRVFYLVLEVFNLKSVQVPSFLYFFAEVIQLSVKLLLFNLQLLDFFFELFQLFALDRLLLLLTGHKLDTFPLGKLNVPLQNLLNFFHFFLVFFVLNFEILNFCLKFFTAGFK